MKIYNFKQRCAAWFNVRSKKLTASRAQAIANNGDGLRTYIDDMMSIYYGLKEPVRYSNEDTQRGIDNEPSIKFLYELKTGLQAEDVGFVLHSPYVGASPDYFIPGVKGAEFKSPRYKGHVNNMNDKIYSSYIWQVQMSMFVCELDSWDFISFCNDPRLDPDDYLYMTTIYRDDKMIEKLKVGIETGIQLIKEYETKME